MAENRHEVCLFLCESVIWGMLSNDPWSLIQSLKLHAISYMYDVVDVSLMSRSAKKFLRNHAQKETGSLPFWFELAF